jgi:hypothetical protein
MIYWKVKNKTYTKFMIDSVRKQDTDFSVWPLSFRELILTIPLVT